MKNIFTIAYSREEANEIGHFIMSKGYEGVQNDSYSKQSGKCFIIQPERSQRLDMFRYLC